MCADGDGLVQWGELVLQVSEMGVTAPPTGARAWAPGHGSSWFLTTLCHTEAIPKHRRHHSRENDAICLQPSLHTILFRNSPPKRKTTPEASRGAEERDPEGAGTSQGHEELLFMGPE